MAHTAYSEKVTKAVKRKKGVRNPYAVGHASEEKQTDRKPRRKKR